MDLASGDHFDAAGHRGAQIHLRRVAQTVQGQRRGRKILIDVPKLHQPHPPLESGHHRGRAETHCRPQWVQLSPGFSDMHAHYSVEVIDGHPRRTQTEENRYQGSSVGYFHSQNVYPRGPQDLQERLLI